MARSAELNRRMRDERREQILAAALELFVSRGLAATRASDIAAAAGISQGLVYHYFGSKDDIYVELIRTAFEGMNEAVRALEADAGSPREKIARALSELLRLLESREDFARYFMLTAQASQFEAVPARVGTIVRKNRATPYEVIARILAAGQRDGSIRQHDADELAVVFWVVIKGLAMQRAAFGKAFKAPGKRLLMSFFLSETSA